MRRIFFFYLAVRGGITCVHMLGPTRSSGVGCTVFIFGSSLALSTGLGCRWIDGSAEAIVVGGGNGADACA